MDFFATNNLIKKEFLSYLSEWDGINDWKYIRKGFPSLKFDFFTQNLLLEFYMENNDDSIRVFKLKDFKFSINQKRHTLVFELDDNMVDVAISFKAFEFCAKFKTLLIYYIQVRKFKRKEIR